MELTQLSPEDFETKSERKYPDKERKGAGKISPDKKHTDDKIASCSYIIFLGINHVLSDCTKGPSWVSKRKSLYPNQRMYTRDQNNTTSVHLFRKQSLASLHSLIDELSKKGKVGIVITSAWRSFRSIDDLKKLFQIHKFSEYVVSKIGPKEKDDETYENCKDLGRWSWKLRGTQIKEWLDENNWNNKPYVIFDNCRMPKNIDSIDPLFGNRYIYVPDCLRDIHRFVALDILLPVPCCAIL